MVQGKSQRDSPWPVDPYFRRNSAEEIAPLSFTFPLFVAFTADAQWWPGPTLRVLQSLKLLPEVSPVGLLSDQACGSQTSVRMFLEVPSVPLWVLPESVPKMKKMQEGRVCLTSQDISSLLLPLSPHTFTPFCRDTGLWWADCSAWDPLPCLHPSRCWRTRKQNKAKMLIIPGQMRKLCPNPVRLSCAGWGEAQDGTPETEKHPWLRPGHQQQFGSQTVGSSLK